MWKVPCKQSSFHFAPLLGEKGFEETDKPTLLQNSTPEKKQGDIWKYKRQKIFLKE